MSITKTKHTRVHVFVELDVQLKENSLVAHNPDSIAAAVRHALRTCLPVGSYTKGGYKFDANTVHAEVKETADV